MVTGASGELAEGRGKERAQEATFFLCSIQRCSHRCEGDETHKPQQTMQYNGKSIRPSSPSWTTLPTEKTATGEVALLRIEKQIEENTNTLVPALTSIGRELELSKEVVVLVWMGTDALVAAKQSRADGRLSGGTKATPARYLGDFSSIRKRVTASNTGYCAHAGVRRSRNVSFKSKSFFFSFVFFLFFFFFFSICWYSTPCCRDSRSAFSPKARWTNCKHMLIHWPDERWAGVVGVLPKVTTTE